MSRSRRRKPVRRELEGRNLSREQYQTLARWLHDEVDRDPPAGWQGQLPQAVTLGLAIDRDFQIAFNAAYLAALPGQLCPGERWVRRYLGRRFRGYLPEAMVETILERIRDRRLILLHSLKRKQQPSLFVARNLQANLIPGFLRRVVWIECRKATISPIRTGYDGLEQLHSYPTATEEITVTRFSDDGWRLAEFWSEANGFKLPQQYEGLVSLGLGYATNEPILRSECESWLRIWMCGPDSTWEQRRENLSRRIGRLLAEREELQTSRRYANDAQESARIDTRLGELERRIQRVREQMREHFERFRPRAAQVGQILEAASVPGTASTIRHRRIRRECSLLRDRVVKGKAALPQVCPPSIGVLASEITSHLGREPQSARKRKLTKPERHQRQHQAHAWASEGWALLERIRAAMREIIAQENLDPETTRVILDWLADAEDLYEFGVLTHDGVIGGLGRRFGRRLERLLRVDGRTRSATQTRTDIR